MAPAPLGTVLQHLRDLLTTQTAQALTDGQLLHAFAAHRGEAAFTVLVQRHGPLVWGVCRHVLQNEHDAEDAFQATFLVLARKAASIRKRESVGSWLHGVAYRIARKAKANSAKRRDHEKQAGTMPHHDTTADIAWRELQALLHEEVGRLPEKYRAPFVLCCLEGKSKPEAAQELGWKEGTVSGRLAQARKQVQQRLTRRGVTLAAVLGATAVAQGTAPAALVTATVRAALAFVAGAATGTVSAQVAGLAQGMLKSMVVARVKTVGACLLALSLLAAGAGLASHQVQTGPHPEASQEHTPMAAARDEGSAESLEKQPRLDRYGDPLPPGALARLGTVRWRQNGPVTFLAYSGDGKTLASSGVKTFHVWEATTGRLFRQFPLGGKEGASCFAIAPDGKLLATGGVDGLIRLRELATGKELRTIQLPKLEAIKEIPPGGADQNAVFQVVFSPDGMTLASVSWDEKLHLWYVATGKELGPLPGPRDHVTAVRFAPDGKRIAVGSEWQTHLCDLATGKVRHRLEGTPIAFSPEGKLLALMDTYGAIHLFETALGKKLFAVGPNGIRALAFSPDSKILALANPTTCSLWDTATGQALRSFPEARSAIVSLAFAPDGRTLAIGGHDGAIHLGDVATGRAARQPTGHGDTIHAIAFAPDSKTVATGGQDGMVLLWEAARGWDLRQLEGHTRAVRCLAYAPDGRTLVSGSDDWILRWWEPARGKLYREVGVPSPIRDVAFAPDGKTLASAGDVPENVVRLWDAAGEELRRFDPGGSCVAFSADGKSLAVGQEDKTIRLWDVATGTELRRLQGHRGAVVCLAGSPDGTLLASGSRDGTIRLWEWATGKPRGRFSGHNGGVYGLAFSSDGWTLASAGADRTVRLWEVVTGKERRRFEGHHGSVLCLAYAPDGRAVASAGHDPAALVWDVTGRVRGGRLQPREFTPAELKNAWTDLASDDGPTAFDAIWAMIAAPEQAVPFLNERLRPAAVDASRIARLIADLDSDQFAVRQQAAQDLEQLGELAEPALRRALEGRLPLESRRRIEQLLQDEKRDGLPLLYSAQARFMRAIEVLEGIGSPQAQRLLRSVAEGASGSRLTQAARDAVQRLAKQ
jgi:RNA polymerase sigma factor (sigma-70 family)